MSEPIETPGGLRRWRYTVLFAVGALGLLTVFYKAFGTDPHAVPFMMQDKPAPAFNLKRLDTGERVTLEQFKGKPVLINFWATWCGPCKQEHPVIQWGHENFGDQVQFLGVVYEDSEENAKSFLLRDPTGFPQFLDANGSMAVDYGVTGVPETYFIDREGIIRGKYAMPIDPGTLQKKIIELQGPAASAGSR
jgi:cytochrome c biogenesis protein CcmG, thiol:disulfide interchange protein DsbE